MYQKGLKIILAPAVENFGKKCAMNVLKIFEHAHWKCANIPCNCTKCQTSDF